jgi:hypothetical protein
MDIRIISIAFLTVGVGTAIAIGPMRVPARIAVVIGLLMMPAPVSRVPGGLTEVFPSDLVAMAALVFILYRYRPVTTIQGLAFIVMLGMPLISATVDVLTTTATTDKSTFVVLGRMAGWVSLFVAGGRLTEREADQCVSSALCVWCAIAAVAIAQNFLGVINVSIGGERGMETVLESMGATARTVFWLRRYNLGHIGSSCFSYCVGVLVLSAYDRVAARDRMLSAVCVLLSPIVALSVGSRSGLVAHLVAGAYSALRVGPGHPSYLTRHRASALLILALLATTLAYFAANPDASEFAQRFAPESIQEGTVGTRGVAQLEAIHQLLTSPRVASVGAGLRATVFRESSRIGLAHAHSEYLDMAYRTGLIGGLLYVVFLAMLWKTLGRSAISLRYRSIVVAGLVTGLASHHITVPPCPVWFYFLALLYGLGAGAMVRGRGSPQALGTRGTLACDRPPAPTNSYG